MPTAEQAVLGLCMHDAEAKRKAFAVLSAKHFRKPEHAVLWNAIRELHERKRETGPIELNLQTEKQFTPLICDIDCKRPITLNPDFFIDELLAREWHSEMLNAANKAIAQLSRNEVFDFEEFAKQYESRPTSTGLGIENPTLTEIALDDLEGRIMAKAQGVQQNIQTNWPTLDKLTNGIKHGSFTVLAGRPGSGKTSLALSFARQFLKQKLPTLFFTWEMTEKELLRKLISGETGIESNRLDEGDLDETKRDRLMSGIRRFSSQPLTIYSGVPNIDAVCNEIRMQNIRNTARVAFVDYLGLIHSTTPHRSVRERMIEITRKMKTVSLETGMCIFGLAQLRRLNGVDRQPTKDDLKESGSLEEDADNVFLIWSRMDDDGWRNDLIVEKARHGKWGKVRFVADFGKNFFGEYSEG